MKKIFRLISYIMACSLVLGIAGSCSEDKVQSDKPVPAVPNTDKKISEAVFSNPDTNDLPMVQMHNPSAALIDDVASRGYGGVVMNVAWNNNYLNDPRDWSRFASCVEYAINKGMYVWIYDEYGYPSGCAYGQTLKGNPEYEALGLVPVYKIVGAGQEEKIDIVYGHRKIEIAFVYDGSSRDSFDIATGRNISHLISSDGKSVTYRNRTLNEQIIVAYMSKRWYENTHAMENWYTRQRYIDMLDPRPARKFLNITHDKYYEYVGEHFGKGIKAFFTDEPALQGNYFDLSDRPRNEIDKPDLDIPIIESLNFSDNLFNAFKKAYNYDLTDYIGHLYRDDGSTLGKQVRMDFYQLTSDLFRNNYLGQTADWCGNHGVKSSGHLLLEETLYQNPWFAGNMLQLLGTMGIPGTDMLFSTAARALKDTCIVSKLASSAADFLNKEDTFAEISGAFDGTVGDVYSQINAVGAQVAMGINNFSSYYYQGNYHTKEEDLIFSKALGRMRYMVTGSHHRAKVALYYPYEGISAVTLPTKNMWRPADDAKMVSDNFMDLCRTLSGKQVDYTFVDSHNLCKCEVKDGKLISPSGEEYQAIVIPYTPALRSAALEKLVQAQNAGVKVILQDNGEVVCERGKDDAASMFNRLADKAEILVSSVKVGNYLKEHGYVSAIINEYFAEDFCVTCRENSNYRLYTVVNGFEEDKNYKITLDGVGKVKCYNPVSGTVTQITDVKTSHGKTSFNFDFEANRTIFFVIEK